MTLDPGAPRGIQALQGGRQGAREAVLPVRDVPRHGDEPRRRPGDRRARVHLEVHDARSHGAGWLGALYTDKADPGTTNFVPRPDWYFYFLFYLLRIFKWPESVILGTIGIPTICLILLIALPFVDRGTSGGCCDGRSRSSRRSSSSSRWASLTYKGAVAKEALASEIVARRADVGREAELPGTRGGRRREALRAVGLPELPYVSRHRRLEPRRTDLSARAEGQGVPLPDRPSECPRCVNPGSPMPSSRPRRGEHDNSASSSRRPKGGK